MEPLTILLVGLFVAFPIAFFLTAVGAGIVSAVWTNMRRPRISETQV